MAQMPRGEPHSVPDPDGDRYDEKMRRERSARQRSQTIGSNTTALRPALFPGVEPITEVVKRTPRSLSTSTIGGQTYRVVDRGGACVLVPIDDPSVSPAELAENKRAVERILFMEDNTLGGSAYGIASFLNASPKARDQALVFGGLAGTAMLGAAPRAAPSRGRAQPWRARGESPSQQRENIRARELNSDGQAQGVAATLTTPMLGTGTRANGRRKPPGWSGNGDKFNEARGHLLGRQLGGSGNDMRNLVTLTHIGANTPQMSDFEHKVAGRVRAGEVVEYTSTPLYGPGALPPSHVLLTATGSRGTPTAALIRNPAGQRR
jgi:hypothetical protein